CVVNSAALRLAGITAETEEPPRGVIDREPSSGDPSGLLYETAQELVRRVMPPPSAAEMDRCMAVVSRQLLEWGVTAIQDATVSNGLSQWESFKDRQQRGLV